MFSLVFCVILYNAYKGSQTSVSQPLGRDPVPDPGINYTGPSSYRKKNLPGRGLTKVQNYCPRLTPQSWVILENLSVAQLLEISQYFMKPEGSLQCLQEPANGTYPEPDQSSPYHPVICAQTLFFLDFVHRPDFSLVFRKIRTMDKVRKPNISVCYTPSSEPYSIYLLFFFTASTAPLGPGLWFFSFMVILQTVGLLGWLIRSSQSLYLNTGQYRE
jgi:hypothetical protein